MPISIAIFTSIGCFAFKSATDSFKWNFTVMRQLKYENFYLISKAGFSEYLTIIEWQKCSQPNVQSVVHISDYSNWHWQWDRSTNYEPGNAPIFNNMTALWIMSSSIGLADQFLFKCEIMKLGNSRGKLWLCSDISLRKCCRMWYKCGKRKISYFKTTLLRQLF